MGFVLDAEQGQLSVAHSQIKWNVGRRAIATPDVSSDHEGISLQVVVFQA